MKRDDQNEDDKAQISVSDGLFEWFKEWIRHFCSSLYGKFVVRRL